MISLTVNIKMDWKAGSSLGAMVAVFVPQELKSMEMVVPDVPLKSTLVTYTVSKVDGVWMERGLFSQYFSVDLWRDLWRDPQKVTDRFFENENEEQEVLSWGRLSESDISEIKVAVSSMLLTGKSQPWTNQSTKSIREHAKPRILGLGPRTLEALGKLLAGLDGVEKLMSYANKLRDGSAWAGFSLHKGG